MNFLFKWKRDQKNDSRNNGNNLSTVEIYQIWDNVSIREQQLEAQLFKYSGRVYFIPQKVHITHSADIIYGTATPTGAQ